MPTFIDPADASRDHGKAQQRGRRVGAAVARIVDELHAIGLVPADRLGDVKVLIGSLLVDEMFQGQAVDVPNWRALR